MGGLIDRVFFDLTPNFRSGTFLYDYLNFFFSTRSTTKGVAVRILVVFFSHLRPTSTASSFLVLYQPSSQWRFSLSQSQLRVPSPWPPPFWLCLLEDAAGPPHLPVRVLFAFPSFVSFTAIKMVSLKVDGRNIEDVVVANARADFLSL